MLAAVVARATLPVFHAGQSLTLRRTVAFELLRDAHPWHRGEACEQRAEKLRRGLRVAPTLDEHVQDVVVLINRPPQIRPRTRDGQEDLVQRPCVARLRTTATQAIGILLPTLPTPLPDGFRGP